MWCGGGHKECPEKGNEHSSPLCCSCAVAERENLILKIIRGCSHAKEELPRKKVQKTPTAKNPVGRAFSSRYTTPTISFAAAAVSGDH
jgi:hypothetical protein